MLFVPAQNRNGPFVCIMYYFVCMIYTMVVLLENAMPFNAIQKILNWLNGVYTIIMCVLCSDYILNTQPMDSRAITTKIKNSQCIIEYKINTPSTFKRKHILLHVRNIKYLWN